MESVGPDGQKGQFSRLNDPWSGPWMFGDTDFRRHFCQNILWTSVKTLVMEQLNPDGEIGPFSRSNEPRSLWSRLLPTGKPTIFKVKQSPKWVNPSFCQFLCAIVHGSFGDLDFRHYFCQNFSWTFNVKTLAMELVGPDRQTAPFSRSNE
ncbi:hypothetical protein H5410_056507 [Solanum commersonii]|uniref:Uncharacterized protein n=1 Tax=Solanum commersonii TaxID=4109 RepID=A0A9J5WLX5_SOLCO|nr:hypothetical protein H5410_056507 [Solanum commersonii]